MKDIHVNLHNIRNCICGKCPSFPGKWKELTHADMPGLFCAHGKSKLEISQHGCLCGDCQVYSEHELTHGGTGKQAYFCAYGSIHDYEAPLPEQPVE